MLSPARVPVAANRYLLQQRCEEKSDEPEDNEGRDNAHDGTEPWCNKDPPVKKQDGELDTSHGQQVRKLECKGKLFINFSQKYTKRKGQVSENLQESHNCRRPYVFRMLPDAANNCS